MNWAFEFLGLRPDADAASVKRAYARLLRTTRPDEDAEGFQRLHAAYKAALAHASTAVVATAQPASSSAEQANSSQPFAAGEADATTAPSPAATQAAPPVIHLGAVAADVIRAASEAKDAAALSNWLQSRPEFWSIQVKQQAGHLVLQRLFKQPQAMSADCMDTLLKFFDLDHVLSGVNTVALRALRRRQMALWELLPANHRALAQRIGKQYGSYPEVASLKRDIALLQRPFSWARTWMAALQIGRTRAIGHLTQALLDHGRLEELPPTIDRHHAYFWFRATARGPMTWPRFAVRSLHVGLAAFACALLVSGIYFLHLFAPADPSVSGRTDIPATMAAFAIAWLSIFSLWLLFAAGVWFDQWQGMSESVPSRWPWLRRLAIPAMCAAGLAVYELGTTSYVAWFIALCFIFALRKLRRRMPAGQGFFSRITSSTPGLIWISVWSISVFLRMQGVDDFPFVPIVALATLAMSALDLWQHRAYLFAAKLARS